MISNKYFKKLFSFTLVMILIYILITPSDCYANTNTKISIEDTISDTTLLTEYRQYTFAIKEKMKIKISVSVDNVSNNDGDYNYITFDLDDNEYNTYTDYWEINEGETQTETFELGIGKYTISIFGYTDNLEQLQYSFNMENVSVYADNISIPEKTTVVVGDSKKLKTTLLPSGAYSAGITWSTSNENVATVSKYGTIKGVSAGECIIEAALEGGNTAKCKVIVKPLYATKISTTEKLSLYVGNSKTLTIKATEGGKKINVITWSSSNNKVAKVSDEGKITGVKAGNCTISGKMKGGNTVKCTVAVSSRPLLYITEASFDINYVGGIEPYITFQNNFGKTIKYVYFNTYFYNTVGDPAYCEIQNTNYQRLKITGPIKNGVTDSYYWDAVIYNNATGKMYLKSAEIVFMDGTKKTLSIKKSYK
ncbi:MAG: Ig-like domain-containing protein [Herbinix sp.]|nr:Ig-like domain-containing protein [Herbinix sp.]